jgi:hypothetical protein
VISHFRLAICSTGDRLPTGRPPSAKSELSPIKTGNH